MQKKINSLYIHIPFCEHICSYCDFTKLFYNKKFSEPYVKALLYEISTYKISKVDTIYIGGGTPTALSDAEFELVLKNVSTYLSSGGEFSVEANVENLTPNKILLMKKYGVTRVSIGVESTDDKTLKLIGRHHTFSDAVKQVNELKKYFEVNVDLIYGFPSQSLEDLKNDLNNILSLETNHIAIYSLIVEKNTVFYNQGIIEQNEDDSRLFYDYIVNTLRKFGYKRYEVSNFARNEKYSRHNLTYWHDEEYYGVGLGASGYVNGHRYVNTKNLDNYLNHKFIDYEEKLTEKEKIEDFLLCNFRLEDGFLASNFKNKFGKEFTEMFADKIQKLIKNKLLIINNDRISLSDEGIALLDRVLLELL